MELCYGIMYKYFIDFVGFQFFSCRSLTLSLLMSYIVYMELLVKPEILTSYIYMDVRLATLKAVSIYLLHNVSTLNQRRKLSCGTVVCKLFASYQGYLNYGWDLIRYAKS
jgi:hypothetical protein